MSRAEREGPIETWGRQFRLCKGLVSLLMQERWAGMLGESDPDWGLLIDSGYIPGPRNEEKYEMWLALNNGMMTHTHVLSLKDRGGQYFYDITQQAYDDISVQQAKCLHRNAQSRDELQSMIWQPGDMGTFTPSGILLQIRNYVEVLLKQFDVAEDTNSIDQPTHIFKKALWSWMANTLLHEPACMEAPSSEVMPVISPHPTLLCLDHYGRLCNPGDFEMQVYLAPAFGLYFYWDENSRVGQRNILRGWVEVPIEAVYPDSSIEKMVKSKYFGEAGNSLREKVGELIAEHRGGFTQQSEYDTWLRSLVAHLKQQLFDGASLVMAGEFETFELVGMGGGELSYAYSWLGSDYEGNVHGLVGRPEDPSQGELRVMLRLLI